MATGIEAANWLILSAAWKKDQGLPFTKSSMAKLFASELAEQERLSRFADPRRVTLFKNFKVERLYRDARPRPSMKAHGNTKAGHARNLLKNITKMCLHRYNSY